MAVEISKAELTCPYCGLKQKVTVGPWWEAWSTSYCDSEAGGCDKLFVYKHTSIQVTFDIRKVEGEETP